MSLRANLIRLAHDNPEVRGRILPLLTAKEAALPPAQSWLEMQVGKVFHSKGGGEEFWFIPSAATKSNSAKGAQVVFDPGKRLPSKAKQTTVHKMDLSSPHWKEIPASTIPPEVAARFQEAGVRVASTDHLAALVQPKGMKPTYQGNAMAVPLVWGGVGVMKPYDVARAMVPLFRAAKNGVAFVLDQNSVFSKPGISEVSRALEQAIKDQYGEEHAMTSEYFEDARPGSKDYENVLRAGAQATMADKVRVSITPVISPVSGKSGLKVVFRPTFEQIEAL